MKTLLRSGIAVGVLGAGFVAIAAAGAQAAPCSPTVQLCTFNAPAGAHNYSSGSASNSFNAGNIDIPGSGSGSVTTGNGSWTNSVGRITTTTGQTTTILDQPGQTTDNSFNAGSVRVGGSNYDGTTQTGNVGQFNQFLGSVDGVGNSGDISVAGDFAGTAESGGGGSRNIGGDAEGSFNGGAINSAGDLAGTFTAGGGGNENRAPNSVGSGNGGGINLR